MVAAVLLLATSNAAAGDTVFKPDPLRDAPPRLDVDGVVYKSTSTVVSTQVSVPGLIRSGGVSLVVAPGVGGTDYGYVATVAVRADGTLSKSFALFDNETNTPIKCAVRAKWRVGRGIVSLTVPRVCIPVADRRFVYLAARTVSFIDETEGDYAPPALHLATD